jgi:hypothetical protein
LTDCSRTLLRFVLSRPHPDTGVRDGIFSGAYELSRAHWISASDYQAFDELLTWFETNLAVPERFNRSKSKGYYRRNTAGVSWLKPSASEHLAKMRLMAAILVTNGYQVSQVTTKRPGYVIFEDDHQVIAEPFRSEQR